MSAIAIPGLVITAVVVLPFVPLIYFVVFKEDGTAHERVVALISAWRRKSDDDTPKKGAT